MMVITMKKISALLLAALFLPAVIPAYAINYSGMIVTDIDRPAAGATITVTSLSDPSETYSATTDTTGTFSFDVTEVENQRETAFALYGNFPNPFNPSTRISYSLDTASDVVLSIYNVLGQKVRTIYHGTRNPGFYSAIWDGKDENGMVSSAGVYLYQLQAAGRVLTGKMLMVDAATGQSIAPSRVNPSAYKSAADDLYMVTVTHPEAVSTLTLGPLSLNETADTTLMIERDLWGMKRVSKNTYFRGTDKIQYPNLHPPHQVTITHDYLVDKYEVTVGQFCEIMNHALNRGALRFEEIYVYNSEGDSQPLFLARAPGLYSNIMVCYDGEHFFPDYDTEKLPINFVSWYGALFYCHERNIIEGFDQAVDITDWSYDLYSEGYRLPSDAEWELAARWTDNREYAFGPDPGHYKPMNVQLNDDGFDDVLSPAGWFAPQGDTHDGMCDMSGNVCEWCLDSQGDYPRSWADSTFVDPINPTITSNRIARGGCAQGCFRSARTFDKANIRMDNMLEIIGIRSIRVLKD